MYNTTINIIHLPNDPKYPHREKREKSVIYQMGLEGCQFKFWDGITGNTPKVNISRAHKQIVQWAKENNLESVCIGEDDLKWTGTNAWKYFIDNKPNDYDLYLSGYYGGRPDKNNIIKNFSGLTLYFIHSRFYDKFLSADEKYHIDSAMGFLGGKYVVCDKFVAIQSPGHSDNVKKYVDYKKRLEGKPMYYGE